VSIQGKPARDRTGDRSVHTKAGNRDALQRLRREHVAPGVDAPHRIFNAGDTVAITIHTYGRDLTLDPAAINIYV